jgi:diadenosine tetraphosphate (Ap4A) HIT family hydrolase
MDVGFDLLETFKQKEHIVDLELCTVLMEDKEYPWILLIPQRTEITQLNQLSDKDSVLLIREINFSSDIMERLFVTDRLNVAAIGNKTPQLHIHIISRRVGDRLWPETIWGCQMQKLTDIEKTERATLLRSAFRSQPRYS